MRIRILAALAVLAAASAQAQEAAASVEGKRYVVSSDLGEADAKALADELDVRFEVYGRLFRFDPAALGGKLRARAFADAAAYDAYLTAALGSTVPGSAYLHYPRPEKRELVVLRSAGGAAGRRALARQAFVQYLRAFVANPPSWMREGFATYFETLEYDPSLSELSYEENLGWLDTVKAWKDAGPSAVSVVLYDAAEGAKPSAAEFQAASWALASFLLNTDVEDYRRSLYEAIMVLDPAAPAADNARAAAARMGAWTDAEAFRRDYLSYLSSRKTFAELVEEGRSRYAAKEIPAAEAAFAEAASLRPRHYAPHYYLGLLSYEKKDYAMAENHYRTAAQLGAEEALTAYALGVNALADGRADAARIHLARAKAADPARYGAKADELLSRIK